MNPGAALDTAARLKTLSPEFLDRYNRTGPRYTSYPTAPEWTEAVTGETFRKHIREDCRRSPLAPLSVYVHIPFCEHRCVFCACNVIISPRHEIARPYLECLAEEMTLVAGEMAAAGGSRRPVTQLHFGGGTPTYLTPAEFAWFMERFREQFHLAPDAEVSIEIDPCVTSREHMETLAALGFNRASFGVQDFHEPTQRIIERVQTVEETRRIADWARELGFQSVNFDLVYGLPLQTVDTFQRTLDRVLEIRPDRIAFYNFAYLPQRIGHQRRIEPTLFPSGPEKFRIFVTAYERFTGAGYEYIGMDHYALPDDPLAKARRDRTIQRNFMGYTTQAGTDIYAFGVSSISATQNLYVQNTKKLSRQQQALESGCLPVERGIVLSGDDQIRKAVIYEIMCHGRLDKRAVERRFGIEFDRYFAGELAQLPAMERDGLIVQDKESLSVTLLGTIFIRNVAMVFDAYLKAPKAQATFSRTL